MKSSHRKAENNLLIYRLNQWAVKHSLLEDPYLFSVSRAIENNEALDFRATLDPGIRLPQPLSRVGEQLITWSRYIAIVRNILVFVSDSVTWKAFAEATSAFSELINSKTATPINFLEFWQNG